MTSKAMDINRKSKKEFLSQQLFRIEQLMQEDGENDQKNSLEVNERIVGIQGDIENEVMNREQFDEVSGKEIGLV